MPKNKKCQFKTNFAKDYTCPELPLEDSNYCIFHKPHKTKGQQKLFKNSIKKKLQNKDYVFTGFCFPNITNFASLLEQPAPNKPPGFEKDVDFRGSTFERDASFGNVIFHRRADFRGSTFEGFAAFNATTFHGHADFRESLFEKFAEPEAPFFGDWNAKFASFEKSTFMMDVLFEKTVFKGWAIFRRSTFNQYADFKNSTFERNAAFEASTFRGRVCFKESIFPGSANFQHSTFKGNADFAGSLFQLDADFKQSTFRGDADFTESVVQRDADFEDSTFEKDVDFTGSVFHGGVDFAGSNFKRNAVFENMTFRNKLLEEKTFRIIKNHYQREGQYTLAGEYYYKERIAKRKQLPWYSPKRWSEYILLDGLCGYGERPLRAIRTGLGVLFGLAFLYWRLGHIYPSPELFNEPHTLTFWDALYFSVVTFTTLGFGDWRPDPSHWIRYVVISEAFIGAFLMALFIVTFARRMMR